MAVAREGGALWFFVFGIKDGGVDDPSRAVYDESGDEGFGKAVVVEVSASFFVVL